MGNSSNDDWIAWAVSAAAGVIGLVAAAVLGQQSQQQTQSQPTQNNNPASTSTPAPKKPGCGCNK